MTPPLTATARALAVRFDWPREIAWAFQRQWVLFVVPLLFLTGNEILFTQAVFVRRVPVRALFASLLVSLPLALFALFVARVIQLGLYVKPKSPLGVVVNDFRELVTSPRRLANGLPVIAAMLLFNKAALDLKPTIPAIKPFVWDADLAQLDRALHFGIDPWRLLQPILGYDYVTFAVNVVYNLWFLCLFGLLLRFAFESALTELRTRFILSYMLTWWIAGGLVAVLFSSAGPCYYGLVVSGPDPFAPLMRYLNDVDTRVPVAALHAQKLLWNTHLELNRLAPGISAFPSVHNAIATTFLLVGWRLHRIVGWIFAVNLLVILVGSVHTGWHYAIDGYAGIAIALACWWLAGRVSTWHHQHGVTTQN